MENIPNDNPDNLTREEYKERIKPFIKTYISMPAYNFLVDYAETMKKSEAGELGPEDSSLRVFFEDISLFSDPNINKNLRLVEIEEDLISLLETTDNKTFYRPLFFPTIFINNNFKFENLLIKGLLILDTTGTERIKTQGPELFIYSLAMDLNTYDFISSITKIGEKRIEFEETTAPTEEQREQLTRLHAHLQNLVCNIIDMVEGNDEDLEITIIETTPEQNIKRIKRQKIPLPNKIFIRANKEFKQYVHNFNEEDKECKETKLTCKFLVRGHWKHFRAERYIRKKGEKTWVKPFYKGQGIVVAKPYKIIK